MQTIPILLGNTPSARRRFVILPVLLLALVLLTLLVSGDVRASSGWELTVYYTPVESYHGGTPTKVYGCPTINCDSASATQYLGTFPSDFLDKVQQEGAGEITDGQDASTPYLNWTYDENGYYWLDTAARSASGAPLVPWQSSAAASNYPFGTQWSVTNCGTNDDGTPVDPTMCQKVEASTWVVVDRFEADISTYQHADLYVGLEDRPNYENTAPQYFDWIGAATTLGSTQVPHTVSAPQVPSGVQKNTTFNVWGTITPQASSSYTPLYFFYYTGNGWSYYGTVNATNSPYGANTTKYSASYKLPLAGYWLVLAYDTSGPSPASNYTVFTVSDTGSGGDTTTGAIPTGGGGGTTTDGTGGTGSGGGITTGGGTGSGGGGTTTGGGTGSGSGGTPIGGTGETGNGGGSTTTGGKTGDIPIEGGGGTTTGT